MASPIGRNAWLSAALLCVAMLILPALGWILFPRPSAPPRTPIASTSSTRALSPVETASLSTPHRSDGDSARAAPVPRATASGAPTAPVGGVVLDPDGKPAAGALVSCDGADQPASTTTNDDGRFELPPEAVGCEASARHPLYRPSPRVRLSAGDRNTLRLSKGGSIAGTVVDERGSPVASYLIAIESFQPSADDGSPPPNTRSRSVSEPSGDFVIEDLPAGRYVLTASASNMPPTRSSPIDVELGATSRGVRITLARGAKLTGVILDADTRKPIAAARVGLDAATSSGANAIAGSTSDKDGAYALDGVPPGPFSVRVVADGYRVKIVSGLTTRGAPSIREDIALTPRGDGSSGDSELVGIGAVLAPSPQGVRIVSVIDGGPGDRAGLQRGDRITRIDGADASGMTVSDCVQRLRGPEGTRVTISLEREGSGPLELTVVRATIVR